MNRSWSFLCLLVGDFGGLLPALPRGAQQARRDLAPYRESSEQAPARPDAGETAIP